MSSVTGQRVQKVWIEVSSLLDCPRQPTGITRVMLAIVEQWARGTFNHLGLCRLDAERQGFVAVPIDILNRFSQNSSEPEGESAAPRSLLKMIISATKRCLKPLVSWLPVSIKRLMKRKIRSQFRFYLKIARAIMSQLRLKQKRTSNEPLISLGPDDLLLSLGADWTYGESSRTIWQVKKRHKFRSAQLFYDLIPILFPQFFGLGFAARYTRWFVDSVWTADFILAGSQCTLDDIQRYNEQQLLPAKPQGLIRFGDNLIPAETEAPASLKQKQPGPFVLCVGTIEVRKNQRLLYQVWRRIIQNHGPEKIPTLLLVGMRGWMGGETLHLMQNDPVTCKSIQVHHKCTDAELHGLYQNCLFTIYPSLYEGWGLPVAESMYYGKYCIAGKISSIPEIAGELVGMHDPTSVSECETLVLQALEPEFRSERERLIQQRYQKHTWANCARQTAQLLAQAFGQQILKEPNDGIEEGSADRYLPHPSASFRRSA